MGIAYAVVPDDEVVAQASALADRLAGFPANAAQGIKHAIRTMNSSGLSDPAKWFAQAQR